MMRIICYHVSSAATKLRVEAGVQVCEVLSKIMPSFAEEWWAKLMDEEGEKVDVRDVLKALYLWEEDEDNEEREDDQMCCASFGAFGSRRAKEGMRRVGIEGEIDGT